MRRFTSSSASLIIQRLGYLLRCDDAAADLHGRERPLGPLWGSPEPTQQLLIDLVLLCTREFLELLQQCFGCSAHDEKVALLFPSVNWFCGFPGCDRSYRNRRLDGRMRVVADQLKVIELETVYRSDRALDFHLGQRTRFAAELLLHLVEMVRVDVQVAESVDEIARLQSRNVCDHEREQR